MESIAFKKLTFGLNLRKKKNEPSYHQARNWSLNSFNLTNLENSFDDIEKKKQGINSKVDFEIQFESGIKKKKPKITEEKRQKIQQEKINNFRNKNKIYVKGKNIPPPLSTFEEIFEKFGIKENLKNNLVKMNFSKPTVIQMQAIPIIMKNRHLMAVAPTGSGKTLSFGLPLLHLLQGHQPGGYRVLVLTPTRELGLQIKKELSKLSEGSDLKVKFLLKSSTLQERNKWTRADIVITTPQKYVYALKRHYEEVKSTKIKWLVIDESDKLFEEGNLGFRPQLAKIYRKCKSTSGNFHCFLFSATFSTLVDLWARVNMKKHVRVHIGAINSTTASIDQKLIYAGSEAGKLVAMKNLITKGFSTPALLFVQSKERAEELCHEISLFFLNVQTIHSSKSLVQRDGIVKSFREGRISLLICTNLISRGLDFERVNLVINYDFPTSSVDYIHKIGRTGRAGKKGESVTLFTDDDVVYLRRIVNIMKESGCDVEDYMLQIKQPSRRAMRKLVKKVPERESITKNDMSDNKVYKKISRKRKRKKSEVEGEEEEEKKNKKGITMWKRKKIMKKRIINDKNNYNSKNNKAKIKNKLNKKKKTK